MVIATSASTGQGVEEIFTLLARRVVERSRAGQTDEYDDDRPNEPVDCSTQPQEKLRH